MNAQPTALSLICWITPVKPPLVFRCCSASYRIKRPTVLSLLRTHLHCSLDGLWELRLQVDITLLRIPTSDHFSSVQFLLISLHFRCMPQEKLFPERLQEKMSAQYLMLWRLLVGQPSNPVLRLPKCCDFLPFETPFDDLLDMIVIWLTDLEWEVLEGAIFLYYLLSVLLPQAVNGRSQCLYNEVGVLSLELISDSIHVIVQHHAFWKTLSCRN